MLKDIISLIIALSFGTIGNAQDTIRTYFNSDWEVVEIIDEAQYFRKSFNQGDVRKFEDYYINGNIQSTGSFKGDKEEIEVGEFVYYDSVGVVSKRLHYSNGLKVGKAYTYYSDGSIKNEGEYNSNHKEGVWRYYHTNGQPCAIEKYSNDEIVSIIYYDEKGEVLENNEMIINPTYGANDNELLSHIEKNFSYPEEAKLKNIEGLVILKFNIDEFGNKSNILIEKSVHPILDNEALRILSTMEKWTSGRVHNQPVSFEYQLPINFKLTD